MAANAAATATAETSVRLASRCSQTPARTERIARVETGVPAVQALEVPGEAVKPAGGLAFLRGLDLLDRRETLANLQSLVTGQCDGAGLWCFQQQLVRALETREQS